MNSLINDNKYDNNTIINIRKQRKWKYFAPHILIAGDLQIFAR